MNPLFLILMISSSLISPRIADAGQFESDIRDLGHKDFLVRSTAYGRLQGAASDAIPDIIVGADSSSDASVRAQCMRLIYLIRDPRAYDVTKKMALSESEWETRLMAVNALSRLNNPEAPAVLETIAKNDLLPNIRVAAISKFVKASGAASQSTLKALLADPNLLIQLTSAYELARMGDKSGYLLAKNSLNNKGMTVKMTAISVIAYAGTDSDIELLNTIATNLKELRPVQNSALHGIQQLKLGKLSDADKLIALRTSIANPSQPIRIWATKELLRRNDPSSLNILNDVAKQTGHAGQPEAIRAIQSLSNQ